MSAAKRTRSHRFGFDRTVELFVAGAGAVMWRPAFGIDGLSWYYAEEGLYVVRDSRKPTPRFAFVKARNPKQACEAADAGFMSCPF